MRLDGTLARSMINQLLAITPQAANPNHSNSSSMKPKIANTLWLYSRYLSIFIIQPIASKMGRHCVYSGNLIDAFSIQLIKVFTFLNGYLNTFYEQVWCVHFLPKIASYRSWNNIQIPPSSQHYLESMKINKYNFFHFNPFHPRVVFIESIYNYIIRNWNISSHFIGNWMLSYTRADSPKKAN